MEIRTLEITQLEQWIQNRQKKKKERNRVSGNHGLTIDDLKLRLLGDPGEETEKYLKK